MYHQNHASNFETGAEDDELVTALTLSHQVAKHEGIIEYEPQSRLGFAFSLCSYV